MKTELHKKKHSANIGLAIVLFVFVFTVFAISMQMVWPHVDIFNR